MQSYYNTQKTQGQTNDRTTVNLMVRRLSDKWDKETRRLSNGFIRLGLPGNKIKKGTSSTSPSSSSPSSKSSTSTTSTTTTTTTDPLETPMSMQFQPAFNLPFVPSTTKNDWSSSSIYNQIRQQQDMKCRIETLEQQLKHDHQVFEEERAILLKEIKIKDNQLLEKEQQWNTRWSAKMHDIQQQMETERKDHENRIMEWKTRYQAAMDAEQQKHYRRLAYFHERLTAKNVEYAELEQQLIWSSPNSSLPKGDHDINTAHHLPHNRGRRSVSLESGIVSRRNAEMRQKGAFNMMTSTKRHSSTSVPGGLGGLLSAVSSPKDDMYALEIQDMSLRHQASMDNMAAEYKEDRAELLAQHDREKQVLKIEHDAELRAACLKLVQEHETRVDEINQSWQQRWDDTVTQNKRDQDIMKLQWNEQLESEKKIWKDRQIMEQASLKKQLAWSTYELGLMLKEHKSAMVLAKQLNLAIDHTADVEDMKYTLTGLLEAGIKIASQSDHLHALSEKSSNSPLSVGFMNMSIF
ncbi:hypothetical protein BC941DRAFT_53379 [Chlamydoabsidia padenii]|nr:hypothetical protein BC941DRAFT_53379 [Chlamydoabsidia padenii]